MAALFQPSLLDWLFGSGIGTNLGAAVVWVPIGALLGLAWSRTKYWPLHAIHTHLETLHARHSEHAEHLDLLGQSLIDLHEKLDRLEGSTPGGEATPAEGTAPPAG